jgi:hypothetical protein
MRKAQPLYIRLYYQPHLVALVRLIGYQGLAVTEARERLKPLNEQYGQEKMKVAAREIIQVDTSQDPPVARLTATVRKLAWQLLGPPPG